MSGALFNSDHGDRSDDDERAFTQQQRLHQTSCQFELEQFVECVQNQHDIRICQDLNEALKMCNEHNGTTNTPSGVLKTTDFIIENCFRTKTAFWENSQGQAVCTLNSVAAK